MTGDDPLANAAWHALTGAQAHLAERRGRAARFPEDIAPFAAVDDPADEAAWADLAELADGHPVIQFCAPFAIPPGWEEEWHGDGVQLVAPGAVTATHPAGEVPIAALGPDDAADMAALVDAARPGPWLARTHTLGPYVGVRHAGQLVAMAGTRLHLPPYREISAVCTDAGHRGRGLAGALVARLAAMIRADGETPFLQAAASNAGAIRLYEAMGFEHRRTVVFGAYRPIR